MLKIAQVGAGFFSTMFHGPMLKRYAEDHPETVDLAAVCVRSNVERARRYCEKTGFQRVYTDLVEMVERERPDACWVLTSESATREVAGKLLELGIPVLIEKPPGRNLREATELAEIAERTGTPNMVAFNRRFAPCTVKALEWMHDHGPFDRVHAHVLRSKRGETDFVYASGIHAVDLLAMLGHELFGGPERATVVRQDTAAGHTIHRIDLTYQSGATAQCEIIPNAGVEDESYSVYGDNVCVKFTMPWQNKGSRAELWQDGKLVDSVSWPAEEAFFCYGVFQESAAFIEAVQTGVAPHPSVAETLESVAIAEAAQAGVAWSVTPADGAR